jgi:hypothetical protein
MLLGITGKLQTVLVENMQVLIEEFVAYVVKTSGDVGLASGGRGVQSLRSTRDIAFVYRVR